MDCSGGGAYTRNIHHPGLTAKSSRSRDRWSLVVLGISLAHEVGLSLHLAIPRPCATVVGAVCYRWPRTPRGQRWEGARCPCGDYRSQYWCAHWHLRRPLHDENAHSSLLLGNGRSQADGKSQGLEPASQTSRIFQNTRSSKANPKQI